MLKIDRNKGDIRHRERPTGGHWPDWAHGSKSHPDIRGQHLAWGHAIHATPPRKDEFSLCEFTP